MPLVGAWRNYSDKRHDNIGGYGEKLMNNPKKFTGEELKKVGVRIWLECEKCRVSWSFAPQPDGKLPEDYWQCPKGCNI